MSDHAEREFAGNPAFIGIFRHVSLQRWGDCFESEADEKAFFDDDRRQEQIMDAQDQRQAALDTLSDQRVMRDVMGMG